MSVRSEYHKFFARTEKRKNCFAVSHHSASSSPPQDSLWCQGALHFSFQACFCLWSKQWLFLVVRYNNVAYFGQNLLVLTGCCHIILLCGVSHSPRLKQRKTSTEQMKAVCGLKIKHTIFKQSVDFELEFKRFYKDITLAVWKIVYITPHLRFQTYLGKRLTNSWMPIFLSFEFHRQGMMLTCEA